MEITKNLKPFDKILVRDDDSELWKIEFFERYNHPDETYPYVGLRAVWKQCIPFEGNEHLLERPTDKFEWGDKVEVRDHDSDKWLRAVFMAYTGSSLCPYKVIRKDGLYLSDWIQCRKADW